MAKKAKSARIMNVPVQIEGGAQSMVYRAEPVEIVSFGQAGVDFVEVGLETWVVVVEVGQAQELVQLLRPEVRHVAAPVRRSSG